MADAPTAVDVELSEMRGPVEQSVDISKPRSAPTIPVIPTEAEKSADQKTTQTSQEDSKETAPGETSSEDTKETGAADEQQPQDYKDDAGKYVHPDTKAEATADEVIEYYREKFSGSTSGAQQLLNEKKELSTKIDELGATVEESKQKIEEYRKVAEGTNPEGLKLVDLQSQLADAHKQVALLTETAALDAFEKTTPLAASKRDALRSLMRANPKESAQKLWDDNLKAGAEAEAARKTEKKTAQKKSASDTGKGTSTREPAGDMVGNTGLSLKEFNKLPVSERQKLLAKA